jgi:ketosteroid isomerase-like protein
MGMRSGKVLKGSKTGRTSKVAAKRRTVAAKPKARPRSAAAAPRVVTKTVEVDRNEAMRALAQRIVDLTIANDEAGMLALYDANVESKEASSPAAVGIEAIKSKFKMWQSMVTDAAFTPVTVVADGNAIVIEWAGRVTLAASGRLAEMDEVAVHEIRNGKIVKERFYYDPAVLQG